jgi:hypothetical protein
MILKPKLKIQNRKSEIVRVSPNVLVREDKVIR